MFPRLALLFISVTFIELTLLNFVWRLIGFPGTILLVIVTGIVGAALTRREGMRCWRNIQEKLVSGQAPGAELIEGPMILIAGAVLITPGVLTDLCGLLLLIPPVRKAIAKRLAARFRSKFTVHTPGGGGFTNGWSSGSEAINGESPSGDEIIDVTFADPDKPTEEK